MGKKTIIVLLVSLALASVNLADAQQLKKVPRLAFLLGGPSSFYLARMDLFKQGLKELGYVEGKNIPICGGEG